MISINEIIAIAEENGGITYNCVTGEINPPTGYAVSIEGREFFAPDLDPACLTGYIMSNTDCFSPTTFLGLWKNEETWSLDITVVFSNIAMAMGAAERNNQKAIYDFETKKCIYLNQTV